MQCDLKTNEAMPTTNDVAQAVVPDSLAGPASISAKMTRVLDVLERLERSANEQRQEYLSIAQAAVVCGASIKHIRRAVKAGELHCSNIGGPRRPTYRISRQAVSAWMEARTWRACQPKSKRDKLVEKHFGKQRRQVA